MNPWQLWVEALDDPIGKWIIWLTLLLILIVIAVYITKWFRDLAVGGSNEGLGQWSEFERLFAEGKLSQWEYRRLKSTVPKRMADEMLNHSASGQPSETDPSTEATQAEIGKTAEGRDEEEGGTG